MALTINFSELIGRIDGFGKVKNPDINILRGFKKMVTDLARYSKRVHKYKNRSGALSQSLKVVHSSNKAPNLKSSIESDVKHASFIYGGTKDHIIKPKGGGVLSWSSGGKRFYSKGHKVKGIKKEPWIEDNFNARQKLWDSILVKEALR